MSADRRAVHSSTLEHEPGRHAGGACEWRCVTCGELLAVGHVQAARDLGDGRVGIRGLDRVDAVTLPAVLRPLPDRHGDVATFGPPDRVRLRGRGPRGGAAGAWSTEGHDLPVFVYCPRPGCGTGQRVA